MRAVLLLALSTAAMALLEVWLVPGPHVPPGTFAVGGLVGCGLIVAISKALGKAWLQRPDDDG